MYTRLGGLGRHFATPAVASVGVLSAAALYSSNQGLAFAAAVQRPDVLVIGGTGLMGAPTARLLQQQGHRVVIMSRGSSIGTGQRRPTPPSCDTLICDRSDTDAFVNALAGTDCPRIIVDFTAMDVGDIDAIAAAHRRQPLSHYIMVSTNMVYPGGPTDMDITALSQPVREEAAELSNAAAAPDGYGGRKLRAEAALAVAGPPWTVVRPPAVVGPGCDDRHERLHRAIAGLELLPARKNRRPPTARPGRFRVAYCEDVAAVIAAIVSKGAAVDGQVFNVASGEPVTMQEYAAALACELGAKEPPAKLPEDDAGLWNYERQGILDTTKAERELGFRPTSLAKMLMDTAQWHKPFL